MSWRGGGVMVVDGWVDDTEGEKMNVINNDLYNDYPGLRKMVWRDVWERWLGEVDG